VKPAVERGLLVGGLFLYCFFGYYAIGLNTDPDPAAARRLETAFDRALPFVPAMAWFYAWVYTAMLYPLFTVRSPSLFRRVCAAYLVVITASLVGFWAFPVTAEGFRPGPEAMADLDMGVFHNWGLRLNFHLDPPVNLFPSLHLGIAALAALGAWRARRAFGAVAFVLVAGIAAAICLVKQHYAVDGVAGLALAGLAYAAVVRPWSRPEGEDGPAAYGWRGPLGYLAFHASVYGALYVAFALGARPWAW